MDTDWKQLLRPKARPERVADLPISEDRDSKFGIGFIGGGAMLFNPAQAKDFRSESISSEYPKFGRMPLIF
jgi:hypothetical protein